MKSYGIAFLVTLMFFGILFALFQNQFVIPNVELNKQFAKEQKNCFKFKDALFCKDSIKIKKLNSEYKFFLESHSKQSISSIKFEEFTYVSHSVFGGKENIKAISLIVINKDKNVVLHNKIENSYTAKKMFEYLQANGYSNVTFEKE